METLTNMYQQIAAQKAQPKAENPVMVYVFVCINYKRIRIKRFTGRLSVF